jgi:hypothetical protein
LEARRERAGVTGNRQRDNKLMLPLIFGLVFFTKLYN